MDYRDWHTFRDIDQHMGLPKGSAFRCFKHLRDALDQDRDFLLLEALDHSQTIAQLRLDERIYAASINVVLLSGTARERIEARLRTDAPAGRHP